MAFPLEIKQISAIADLAISDSQGRVQQPKKLFEVWSPTGQFEDGVLGSTAPITYRISKDVVDSYQLHLAISGTCTFPSTYPRGMVDVKLIGTIPGGPVIESEPWTVELPGGSPPPEVRKDFNLSEFTLPAPFNDIICPVPIRWTGDFEWKIAVSKEKAALDLVGEKKTRLEMFWLNEKALSGPTVVQGNFMRGRTDLQGRYHVTLLRAFLPRPHEFAGETNFGQSFDPWWVNHVMKVVRSSDCTYNTISGKSSFGVGCCGGSFDLDEFARTALRLDGAEARSTKVAVNSFDIAAITQLGCDLLLDPNSALPVLGVWWTCKTPFGYVKPNLPFGLSQDVFPNGVNNPFFGGSDPPLSPDPFVARSDIRVKSSMCNTRAWLEVDFDVLPKTVIDESSNDVVPQVSSPNQAPAFRDRDTYATARIEPLVGSLADYIDGSIWSNEIYSNCTFGKIPTRPQTVPWSSGLIGRVGVYDIHGTVSLSTVTKSYLPSKPVSPPSPDSVWPDSGSASPFVPIPPVLQDQIKACFDIARNPWFPPIEFNDASLKAINVAKVVGLKSDPPARTELRVKRGTVTAVYHFKDVHVSSSITGNLVLKIHVFDDWFDAYQAMAFELTKYERRLSEAVRKIEIDFASQTCKIGGAPFGIGHYSLQTPHGAIFVRGNVFVESSLVSIVRPDASSLFAATDVAARVDNLMFRNVGTPENPRYGKWTVKQSQVRRPNLIFAAEQGPPDSVKQNTSFKVRMKNVETLAETMYASTSNGRLVAWAGPGKDPYEHEFYVLEKDDETGDEVTVTIIGAHPDTFHPGSVKVITLNKWWKKGPPQMTVIKRIFFRGQTLRENEA